MPTRPLLDPGHVSEKALVAIELFHADTVREVAEAVQTRPLVVVGMKQNPFVRRARKLLDREGIAYTYLEYGSYLSGWKRRLAIKLWSGWPTFPQVFARGMLLGGCNDLRRALGDGTLRNRLAVEPAPTAQTDRAG